MPCQQNFKNIEKGLSLQQLQIICPWEDMQSRQVSIKKEQGAKNLRFLSQYESQSSQLRGNKFRNATSAKILRKLKQLWNRQKYLTDDQCQSSIDPGGSAHMSDSSLNIQVEERNTVNPNKLRKAPLSKKELTNIKNLHRRQLSSEEERLSLPQKMKRKREEKQQKDNNNQAYSINGELSEIEAFNSAIEDFSSS